MDQEIIAGYVFFNIAAVKPLDQDGNVWDPIFRAANLTKKWSKTHYIVSKFIHRASNPVWLVRSNRANCFCLSSLISGLGKKILL